MIQNGVASFRLMNKSSEVQYNPLLSTYVIIVNIPAWKNNI